ncbi:hypothetical protein A0256_15930 [Mucilaginibacter sp. PAMC 26640]|nr:hypothetical protein A0256_15930 [Mucilaginibacter sp. PAMC 26640]
MKTLNNHIILYDADCPMCKAYTKAFTGSGMLAAGGRASYQDMPEAVCPLVDRQRAADEIALVDTQTGEVNYGIRSLFKVIGNSFPVFKKLFLYPPFVWLMSRVYAFVSYNRRVIIPVAQAGQGVQPSFRLGYRMAYLVFAWLVVGSILTVYARHLTPPVPLGHPLREYYICGGQIVFQGVVVFYTPAKRWEYLGNMMTISLAGSLLLLPVLLVVQFVALGPVVCILCFLAVAGLMFLEHIRRSRLMGLGWLLTVSWVLYRLLVLAVILN